MLIGCHVATTNALGCGQQDCMARALVRVRATDFAARAVEHILTATAALGGWPEYSSSKRSCPDAIYATGDGSQHRTF
jgi:hypothetical protein